MPLVTDFAVIDLRHCGPLLGGVAIQGRITRASAVPLDCLARARNVGERVAVREINDAAH